MVTLGTADYPYESSNPGPAAGGLVVSRGRCGSGCRTTSMPLSGAHLMMVFDRQGQFLRSWVQGDVCVQV